MKSHVNDPAAAAVHAEQLTGLQPGHVHDLALRQADTTERDGHPDNPSPPGDSARLVPNTLIKNGSYAPLAPKARIKAPG